MSNLIGIPINTGWDNVDGRNIKTPELEALIAKLQRILLERVK